MNKLNFFLVLILFVGAVCGCNFSYELGGKNSNDRSNSSRASKKPQKQANSETASDETDNSPESSSKKRDTGIDGPDTIKDDQDATNNNQDVASDDQETASDERVSPANASDFSSLTGKWVWGRSGSTTTTESGVYVGSNGSRFTYEFSDDGAVEYTGIMNIMNGSCNMQIFKAAQGQASLNEDQLTIKWEPATFTRKDSCSSSQDYEKTLPAETETLAINFKKSGNQEQLCLTGKDETCFSRAE